MKILSKATGQHGLLDLNSSVAQTVTGQVNFDQAYFNNVPFADVGDVSVQMATLNSLSVTDTLKEGTLLATLKWGLLEHTIYAPSLSGYATQTFVNTQLGGYATKTSVSTAITVVDNLINSSVGLTDGYINDLKVDRINGVAWSDIGGGGDVDLSNYMTLDTMQTVTGVKTFGTLKASSLVSSASTAVKIDLLEEDVEITAGGWIALLGAVYFGSTDGDYVINDDGSATLKSLALETALPITSGGTGATTAEDARANLGLGAAATKSTTTSVTSDSSSLVTSGGVYNWVTGKNYLTSHQTIYNLTMSAGTFSAVTFDPNGAAKTVYIPTKTSHLSNDSGFITKSDNITGSAAKLTTSRTIWGQSFDGTANITGSMSNVYDLTFTNKFFKVNNNGTISIRVAVPGGWHRAVRFADGSSATVAEMGCFGREDTLSHIYIGEGDYTSTKNLRVYSGGNVTIGYSSAHSSKLYVNGDITSSGTVIQGSDRYRKNILGDVTINIEDIAKAPLIKYQWNDGNDTMSAHIGSIAQYWQNVLPETVHGTAGVDMSMEYQTIALGASIVTAREVVALKEEIKMLKEEIKALKGEE